VWDGGVLKVHDDVTFEANAAEELGGAVSLPFEIVSQVPLVLIRDTFAEVYLILWGATQLCRKG